MTGYVCGWCGVGQHDRCTGFRHTELALCPCAVRDHRVLDPEDDPIIRARNERIVLAHVANTLHGGEI